MKMTPLDGGVASFVGVSFQRWLQARRPVGTLRAEFGV